MEEESKFETLDALIEYLHTLPHSTSPRILIPERMIQFQAAYRALAKTAKKLEGTIHSKVSENEGWGSITIETDTLIWGQGLPFPTELLSASNLEVYPLVNGNLRLSVMFYGLTKNIEEVME